MKRTMVWTVALAVARLAAGESLSAQQPRFFYPEPPPGSVRVTSNIRFARADSVDLAMDVYRPARASAPLPALIVYSPYWTSDGRPSRESSEWARSWARIAAANGIVGIIADIRAEPGTGNATTPTRPLGDDFQRLVSHLTDRAPEYGVDRERLAVLSGSGAVWAALPAVQDPRMTAIRAAVMYYGSANLTTFRLDLPLLLVRAGLDSRSTNESIARLASLALSQNAPVTLLNHHSGHHAFEARNDDATTRRVIAQTLEFVKHATAPEYQSAIRAGRLDAAAAAHLSAGNFRGAALVFEELMKQRPADRQLWLAHGQALLADRQHGAACTALRRLTPRGDGSFQAMLPGTRACVLAGSVDTAMVWLRSMPPEWVRSPYVAALRRDSVFAPLWGRPDFEALFKP